jgi:CDP-glucose 4,6-dehydratase
MENLEMSEFWFGKRVLITGHTGFKGSWLSLWLAQMGAQVFGYSLMPDTSPALFNQLSLVEEMDHQIGDIRDLAQLQDSFERVQPDVVFHLAAQPLVLASFDDPLTTWNTNVIGSANVMEAARKLKEKCAMVMVTTDKVYENREWTYPYREIDPLGGHDPYSASKAAMELAIESWRKSFFHRGSALRMASARAGNVIGGGDWSENRIIPDLIRSLQSGTALSVRNPNAIRPWQHVLDPLSGYLQLAEHLFNSSDLVYQSSFNFGPEAHDAKPVRDLIDEALQHWPGAWIDASDQDKRHEAKTLSLTIEKARSVLGVHPRLGLKESIEMTMQWYKTVVENGNPREITKAQIMTYSGL